MLKTNISALYRITINDVALDLGTYSQFARHGLCGRDFGERELLTPCDIGLFASTEDDIKLI